MLFYLILIVFFGLLVLASIGASIYSLLRRRKRSLIIAVAFFLFASLACVYCGIMYSKRTIAYVRSQEFQDDAKKGADLVGKTIGSTTSGLSNGLSKALDEEAINNLAAKSATIVGKATKTIASALDSTIGNKNIYLDQSVKNSGLKLGRADEKYNRNTNDLGIFIDYIKDFKGMLRVTNYDQNGRKIDAVDKEIKAKAGDGRVEVFSFSHSDLGLTTYYILSAPKG